ncbi:hypothetical protein, partial [Streptomyces milbemycinicus]
MPHDLHGSDFRQAQDPVAHLLFVLVGVLIVAAGWSGGRSLSFPVTGWEGLVSMEPRSWPEPAPEVARAVRA